jgi:V8-like Glu-specific endopeptidase
MDEIEEMGFEGYTQFKDRSTFIGEKMREFPYNSLLAVWTTFRENPGQRKHGTAFLISPIYALTCAHNLYSSKC